MSKSNIRVNKEPSSWESLVCVCVHAHEMQGWRGQPTEDFISLGFSLKAMGSHGRVLNQRAT